MPTSRALRLSALGSYVEVTEHSKLITIRHLSALMAHTRTGTAQPAHSPIPTSQRLLCQCYLKVSLPRPEMHLLVRPHLENCYSHSRYRLLNLSTQTRALNPTRLQNTPNQSTVPQRHQAATGTSLSLVLLTNHSHLIATENVNSDAN
jgi:hypothetical protein